MKIVQIVLTGLVLVSANGDAVCSCLPYDLTNSPYATPIANRVGDLVTVNIEENATTVDNGRGQLERKNNLVAELKQLFFPWLEPSQGFNKVAGNGDGTAFELETESKFNAISRNGANHIFRTKITVRLVEEIRPQEFFARGYRLININGKPKKIFLSGVLRQVDISANNTISSDQLADAVVEIEGEVGQKDTQPGIFTRWFNKVF